MSELSILVKFPTRGRPDKFLQVFDLYHYTSEGVQFLVSVDYNDSSMRPYLEQLRNKPNTKVIEGYSDGKIHACNRDIEKADPWDILVLASDDMIPVSSGWDKIIREEMKLHFPDTDGVLFFPDGYTKLNTMCIIGRKYYERFCYIYHPDYISLWCDNEFMEVADRLGKQVRFNQVLFKHEHPANNGMKNKTDNLYRENDKWYAKDKNTYEKRKLNNFGL